MFGLFSVRPHEVSFRVNSDNPEHKTAADIARAINENSGVKNNILRRLGVTVLKAGVGDRVRLEDTANSTAAVSIDTTVTEVAAPPVEVTHLMAYILAGAGVISILIIFIALVLVRRKDRKRSKLYAMQEGNGDSNSGTVEHCSKDYQELCRARMAGGKESASSADVSGSLIAGRLTSLTRDNERPPSSSRSSTSSWNEEPALTNMDISTGHMVLVRTSN